MLTFTPLDPLSPTGPSGPLGPLQRYINCYWWTAPENLALNRPEAHDVLHTVLRQWIRTLNLYLCHPYLVEPGRQLSWFVVHCGLAHTGETSSKIVVTLQILGICELALKHAQSTLCRLCPHLSTITPPAQWSYCSEALGKGHKKKLWRWFILAI